MTISAKVKIRKISFGDDPCVKLNEISFWGEAEGADDGRELLRVDYDLDDPAPDAHRLAAFAFDALLPRAEFLGVFGRVVHEDGRISLFGQNGDGAAGGLWFRHDYPPVGLYRRACDDADLVKLEKLWSGFRAVPAEPDAPPHRLVKLGRCRRDQMRHALLALAAVETGATSERARAAADILFFMVEDRDGETVMARLTCEQLATVGGALRDFIARAADWPAEAPWPAGVAKVFAGPEVAA